VTDSPQPDDESDEESSPFGPFIDLPGLSNIDWSAIDFSQVVRLLESSGPVNWQVARETAYLVATEGKPEPSITSATTSSLEELVRAAQTRIAVETGLAATFVPRVEVLDRRGWVDRSEQALRPVLEALASRFGDVLRTHGALEFEIEADAEDAQALEAATGGLLRPEMLAQLLPQLAPLLFGVQAGSMLGALAQHALGRYDWPLPESDAPTVAFVATNLDAFEAAWSLAPTDLRFYLALHEVVHAAQRNVPWVRERLVRLATEYVSAYDLDTDALGEVFGDLDPTDPEAIQRLTEHPEKLLGAMQTASQGEVLGRLRVFHAVLEGYADVILDRIGRPLLSTFDQIHEAMRRHRIERGQAERFVESLLGLEIDRLDLELGERFCLGVIERAGMEGLDRLWTGEEMVPTRPELEAPGLWLARIDLPATPPAV